MLCPQDALEFVLLAMLLEFLAVHQRIGLLQHILDIVDRRGSCGTAECDADLRRLEVRLQPFQQPRELIGLARRFIMSRLRSRIAKKRVSEASRSDA